MKARANVEYADRNVSLTAELTDYINARGASAHYSNASEVVRAGLRLLIERDGAITAAGAGGLRKRGGADHRPGR